MQTRVKIELITSIGEGHTMLKVDSVTDSNSGYGKDPHIGTVEKALTGARQLVVETLKAAP